MTIKIIEAGISRQRNRNGGGGGFKIDCQREGES